MNTCLHCKHFARFDNDRLYRVDDQDKYDGFCALSERNRQDDTPLRAYDVEMYYAFLAVKRTFGCNAWESQ